MKKEEIENWEGKIYDFLSPVNLTMFREERTEKVISLVKELLKSEREKLLEKIKLEKFEILEGNKYKKGKEEGYFVQTNYALGYNQAVADLEKLKEAINDGK